MFATDVNGTVCICICKTFSFKKQNILILAIILY